MILSFWSVLEWYIIIRYRDSFISRNTWNNYYKKNIFFFFFKYTNSTLSIAPSQLLT